MALEELASAIDKMIELQTELTALKEENKSLKTELAEKQKYILYLEGEVAELVDAKNKVKYTDGLGAVRNSPANCRDGIRYVTVDGTIYWPLSAEEAQLLRSAECGMGNFTRDIKMNKSKKMGIADETNN